MRTTRSATSRANPISCVTTSIVIPSSLAVALVITGCLGAVVPEGGTPEGAPASPSAGWGAPVLAGDGCGGCYEPTVAWLPSGRLVAASANGEAFAASDDGGATFSPIEPPPIPAGAAFRGDVLVQADPAGRLWWSSLLPSDIVDVNVHVARSDDGGTSWTLNHVLRFNAEPVLRADVSDRQWLAFDGPDVVHVVCTCPAAALPQMATSRDGGASFGPPAPIASAQGRPGPVGPPVVPEPGRVVVPYLVGALGDRGGDLQAVGVRVAVSADGGASWKDHVVHVAPPGSGPRCCGFPSAAVGPDGVVHVAWSAADGSVLLASSDDGGTSWGAPARMNPEEDVAVWPHPWVAVDDAGKSAIAWFSRGANGGTHVSVARDGPESAVVLAEPRLPMTDFAHLTTGPNGRLAVTWSEDGVRVAVDAPPASR